VELTLARRRAREPKTSRRRVVREKYKRKKEKRK